MSITQSIIDSASTLIPYTLVLALVWAIIGKTFPSSIAQRLRRITILLLLPHLFVWLPTYAYEVSLIRLDLPFVISMLMALAVEVSLVLVFAIGLFKLIYFARDLSRPPDAQP